jgi:hypothetical protein
MVTVGCNQRCAERLGACEGDPQIRVCAGDFPCLHAQALEGGENDDSCGGQCAQGSFVCPAGGRFTLMVAGHTSGVPAICQPEILAQPLPPEG